MKIWWHKVQNWEYWSVNIIYFLTFFLWLWYALKFRSSRFYHYANPGIKNGGLYGESKMEIYKLLPPKLYPKTILVKTNREVDFQKLIHNNRFHFPFIVKPDTGHRGIGVQRIASLEELKEYSKQADKDFLIQELIDYPHEIGLFYCRLPNETKGFITGITEKRFLTVVGNGKECLETLLKKKLRYEMQIPSLRSTINLSEILPKGEEKLLVPYGNHNRGTEFLDGKNLISEKLSNTFDELLKAVPGFYYGRLDIRYSTFEELEQGTNFSIIELNGVKSEPTHIYQASNSFWQGQKEIYKHQKLLSEIVERNIRL